LTGTCLDADLEIAADPDHARIDGAGGDEAVAEVVFGRRRHLELDDRDQVIDEVGQLQILNLRFQVRHAVLDRSAPGQHLRYERLLHHVERAAWNLIANLPGHREGAQPAGAVGQVAEAFAEIIGRRQRRIGRRNPGIDGTGRTPIDNQAEQHRQFVRVVLEQLVLRRGLEVIEPRHGRPAGAADLRPGGTDRNAEILGDTFRQFAGQVPLVGRRHIGGPRPRHGRQRHLVRHARVVGGERSGKEARADEAMGERIGDG
jgi:hypothetical protein